MTAKALYGTALLLTLLSFFLVPGKSVQASSCSSIGGTICTVDCTGWWFWKKCREKTYWDAF